MIQETNIIDLLLIEDRDEDAELALLALEKNNLANKVKRVKDGQEALDFLFGNNPEGKRVLNSKPRLILLDLKMPKLSGIEVLKIIRNTPETATIPVVILTTSKEEKDIVEAYELGVNSYIVKPVNFDKFIESVKDVGFYWLMLNEPPVRK